MFQRNTKRNFLLLMGLGEATLYEASSVCGLDSQGVTMAHLAIRGAVQIGPKGSDPIHCVILTGMEDNPEGWGLIDYRQAFSDAEVEHAKLELLYRLPPHVQELVKVDSTQDVSFRETALR